MRVLIYVNTPAHAHLYKHAVHELRERGHDVLVLARDYTCTLDVLEWHDVSHEVYGYCGTSKSSLMARLPLHYARALPAARRFDPDLVIGMGGYAAHTGALLRTPVVLLIDSETAPIDHAISLPFARTVLTPDTFRKDLGDNHYVLPGTKECAYLHPDVFEPDPTIRDRLGLEPDESFVLVRLNAFGSHHDVGKRGITPDRRRRLIEAVSEHATVLVSDESGEADLDGLPARPFELDPARIHDALAEADLLIADTQTMVTEAALLGTPAVRSNSFVGDDDMGNFVELERHGLIFNEAEFDELLNRAVTLLLAEDLEEEWQRRRDEFLTDRHNLTELIVDVATNEGRVDELETVRPYGRSSPTEPERPTEPVEIPAKQD